MHIELLNIEIFGGCNLACQMCPQAKDMGGRESAFSRSLPFSVFEKVVTDALAHGVKSVSLHGSGEPTLHKDLEKMVRFVSERGVYVSFFTNGLRLTGPFFERLVSAGLRQATISMVGATRDAYQTWMRQDAFERVLTNLRECSDVMLRNPGNGEYHTRHLITDPAHKDEEIRAYQTNIIEPLGCKAEIWMMHNWADQYSASYSRLENAKGARRTCGRPFADTLEVRAGGLDGHHAAVVPCPYVLGKDSSAVLGHLDSSSIDEVRRGAPLAELRAAHRKGRFDDIEYCRGCDMLADDPEVLVWSNIPGRHVGQSKTSSVEYLTATA